MHYRGHSWEWVRESLSWSCTRFLTMNWKQICTTMTLHHANLSETGATYRKYLCHAVLVSFSDAARAFAAEAARGSNQRRSDSRRLIQEELT